MLEPMKPGEPHIYKMQVKDRACTICVFVGKGGRCSKCGEDKSQWVNAFNE